MEFCAYVSLMNAEQNKTADVSRPSSADYYGKRAIVQCKRFRCLATLGKDGEWRDNKGDILEVLEVVTELP